METKVLIPTEENIRYVASLLSDGEVCGIPTETVYGLAANAFDEKAVEKIFIAKGRPQDNPLIVHISNVKMLDSLVAEVPPLALKLAKAFWPGPLTMIFKKNDRIPLAVTAGLDTVAIRYPSHAIARMLIALADIPLAAPSANISGAPSPTTANHVYNDLKGRIPVILDGGDCEFGLESTVIQIDGNGVTLLRPGAITIDMLLEVAPQVELSHGILNQVEDNQQVLSPGMKHQHYSPKTKMIIVDSTLAEFAVFVNKQVADVRVGAMIFEGEESSINTPCVTYGDENDSIIQARLLFSSLREIDDLNVDVVYARMPSKKGMGLGVYNRLLRACGFEVIKL